MVYVTLEYVLQFVLVCLFTLIVSLVTVMYLAQVVTMIVLFTRALIQLESCKIANRC